MERPTSPRPSLEEDQPLVDPGRSLPLRLLALLGAFSFLMLGLASVLIPLLQTPQPVPEALPGSAERSAVS